MRQFKLYNYDETSSFALYGGSIVVEDISGLGTNLSIVKNEGADRYYVSDMYADFEDIKLKLYFGANGNAYDDYMSLMNFIANNGKHKFVLEYSVEGNTKYCDVWLKSAPKTQKDTTGTIPSEFLFSRLSHWYTKVTITFSLVTTVREVDFPLEIPIPFVGAISTNDVEINNTFFEDYFLDITVVGPLNHDLEIYLKNSRSQIIQRVVIQKVLEQHGDDIDLFYINSETKKVSYYNAYNVLLENGYNDIDHNYDSFITVPNGLHSIGVGLLSGDECSVIISYRKLVLD